MANPSVILFVGQDVIHREIAVIHEYSQINAVVALYPTQIVDLQGEVALNRFPHVCGVKVAG